MPTRAARPVSIIAILLIATATAAQAQLGGLMKKGKDAAAGKAGEAAAAQVPPKTVNVLPCAVTYDQLEALERGLEAELKAAPAAAKEAQSRQDAVESEQKAYEKAMTDYQKKSETWGACRDRVMNDPATEKQRKALEAKSEKNRENVEAAMDEEALQAKAARAQAAAERVANGTATAADRQAMADFQAEMAGVQQVANAAIGSSADT